MIPDDERDRRVLQIYDQLVEIEQRLIPTGLHVLGRTSAAAEKADMLRMVASFDRPEAGARALPDLVAEGLGLSARILSKNRRRPANQKSVSASLSTRSCLLLFRSFSKAASMTVSGS